MITIRKTLIYGNCQVFGPTGKLMFRCLEKRAKWYLDRKLATIMSDDPMSIKLTFTPKGGGEKTELLKIKRQNKCVVCGTEELCNLTKHHLVPFVYRQHFSPERKEHNSLFVVPICRSCHNIYENKFASKLKTTLVELYSAPFNGDFDKTKRRIIGIIRCLKEFGDKIPQDRKNLLLLKLEQKARAIGISVGNPLLENEIDEMLQQAVDGKEDEDNCHGKIVVDKISNLDDFEKMWAKNFIDSMTPKFMPEYITDHF